MWLGKVFTDKSFMVHESNFKINQKPPYRWYFSLLIISPLIYSSNWCGKNFFFLKKRIHVHNCHRNPFMKSCCKPVILVTSSVKSFFFIQIATIHLFKKMFNYISSLYFSSFKSRVPKDWDLRLFGLPWVPQWRHFFCVYVRSKKKCLSNKLHEHNTNYMRVGPDHEKLPAQKCRRRGISLHIPKR